MQRRFRLQARLCGPTPVLQLTRPRHLLWPWQSSHQPRGPSGWCLCCRAVSSPLLPQPFHEPSFTRHGFRSLQGCPRGPLAPSGQGDPWGGGRAFCPAVCRSSRWVTCPRDCLGEIASIPGMKHPLMRQSAHNHPERGDPPGGRLRGSQMWKQRPGPRSRLPARWLS